MTETKIKPAEPEDDNTAKLYQEAMTAMRGTLHAMRRMPGVHTREHEGPVIERFQKAATMVKELAEYADERAAACDNYAEQLEQVEKDKQVVSRLVEMIHDLDRGLRDSEEILDYVKEHFRDE